MISIHILTKTISRSTLYRLTSSRTVFCTTKARNSTEITNASETANHGRSFFHGLNYRPSESQYEPPEPPKHFTKDYKRRPLFNFAMEGNHVFKEANNVVIILIGFNLVVTMAWCIWYKYYYYDCVLTQEERDALYQKTNFPLYKDEKYQAFRGVLGPLIAFSDIGRFGRTEYGNMNQNKDEPIEQMTELINTENQFDVIDPSRVYRREDSGRKKFTLKHFDEQLRK